MLVRTRKWLSDILLRRIPSRRFKEEVSGTLVVVLIAAIGMLFALQGWKSRVPTFDLLIYIEAGHNFLSTGAPPDRGDISSYASFSAPGTGWLMVPGMLLFKDPRLFEYVGSAFLYFGTLLGLFLLVRPHFGTWCACFSVLLYAFSRTGLFFGSTVWPIGHPFFYVWMLYLSGQWITRRDARYVSAAVIIWAAGMYVDMAIAPAFFVLPTLWLFFRPPVRISPLIVAAILALLIWYPYIRFEASRGFVDVKSQVLRQNIFPTDYKEAWCDRSLVLQNWETTQNPSNSNAKHASPVKLKAWSEPLRHLWYRWNSILDMLPSNFAHNASPTSVSTVLLLLVVSTIAILSYAFCRSIVKPESLAHHQSSPHWPTVLAISIILVGVLTNEFVLRYLTVDRILEQTAKLNIRKLQGTCLLLGLMLLARRQIAAAIKRLRIPGTGKVATTKSVRDPIFLVIGIVVPWCILLLVAEPGRTERFLWLWPLQVAILAASVTCVFRPWKESRLFFRIGQGLLLVVLLANPLLLSRTNSWLKHGWSGTDAEEIQLVDWIASELRSRGKDHGAIGYQTFIYGFMAKYHIIDPQYKAGAELDLLLKHRHGIVNTTRCAEGVSPSDEYRIVKTLSEEPDSSGDSLDASPREYFNVPMDTNFRMVRQVGSFRIFRRSPNL